MPHGVKITIGLSPDSRETHTEAVIRLFNLTASQIAPVSAHNPPPPHSGSKTTLVRIWPSSVYTAAASHSAAGKRFSNRSIAASIKVWSIFISLSRLYPYLRFGLPNVSSCPMVATFNYKPTPPAKTTLIPSPRPQVEPVQTASACWRAASFVRT